MGFDPMPSTAMVNTKSAPIFDELLPPLQRVQTRPLFVMRLDVKPIEIVGDTPGPFRRVGIVPPGTFAGVRLNGKVLDGGSDWQVVRSDGSTTPDPDRRRHEHRDDLPRHPPRRARCHPAPGERRKSRSPSYYFRINPIFEAPAGKYEFLNRVIAVGAGHRFKYGPVYSVFEVL
jgi:hypothetical protein